MCSNRFRGLFEGKVGNLWCAASVKPISIRERIPQSVQPLCALSLTFLMVLPFCIILFRIGKMCTGTTASSNLHIKALLWGSAGTSLSFFLASFQVHEKSILLPLAPLSMLAVERPIIIFWFSIIALWSMWHLVVVDRLQVAYFALVILFLSYIMEMKKAVVQNEQPLNTTTTTTIHHYEGNKTTLAVFKRSLTKYTVRLSSFAMIALHILETIISPPTHLPDLFPVLWVIVSCGCFCFMWLIAFIESWELSNLRQCRGIYSVKKRN